jgi:hypothetical protein
MAGVLPEKWMALALPENYEGVEKSVLCFFLE